MISVTINMVNNGYIVQIVAQGPQGPQPISTEVYPDLETTMGKVKERFAQIQQQAVGQADAAKKAMEEAEAETAAAVAED